MNSVLAFAVCIMLFILSIGAYVIMATVDDVANSVTQLEQAVTAAVSKVNQMKSTPGIDPVQLDTLKSRIDAAVSSLTAAVQ